MTTDAASAPLVSVITPVYNDDPYIAECIRSVLAQQYPNFEYIVCDNHSTDQSGAIARELTKGDPRARVVQPPEFCPQQANFNFALSQISDDARFVKLIFADDWLYPNCLRAMVDVALAHPTVGLVGSYGLVETAPINFGLPPGREFFTGTETRQAQIRGEVHPFGSSTNLMFRADLVRQRMPDFFPAGRFFFDVNVFFEMLRDADFGFVHQILAFARKQPDSVMVKAFSLRSDVLLEFVMAKQYGSEVLEPAEYAQRMAKLTDDLYLGLGRGWIEERIRRRRNDELWEFQSKELAAVGASIEPGLLRKGVLRAAAATLANPGEHVVKLGKRLRGIG